MRGALGFAVVLAACTSGAPPGFSGGLGDRWSMPLVGPLEDGLLLTAVTLNTNGPYLFAIDPDAPVSLIDAELVKKLDLRSFPGPKRLDESDTQHTRVMAEMIGLEIGSLIVERRDAIIVRPRTFDTAGRRVLGVIGRDVIADSLVWGFDRDQGVVHVVLQKSFRPPAEATTFNYGELDSRVPNAKFLPPPRRIVDATINGERFKLHVDLGAVASQLRDGQWDKAKLVAREVKSAVIDEVGSFHPITKASEPAKVETSGLANEKVVFVPFVDRRWEAQDIDGTLGLGFFAKHSVWQSWHTKQYWAVPRKDVAVATRIGRWDSAVLQKCKALGCATVRVTDPLAGKPLEEGKQHPGLVLSITRDEVAGGMGLEVTLEARGTETAQALPRLLVNMPGHVDKMLYQLPGAYVGTTIEVVDASPFPRECPTQNGCVDQLAR